MLRPVSFEALDTTLPILSRGFPAMRPERWAAVIGRLRRFGQNKPTLHAGHILESKGKDIGVILTIPSTRDAISPRTIVNLSSWYIDPEHRWSAPRMLQSVTSCDRTIYTDLTATTTVQTMMGRLGFQTATEGTLLFPLPLFALRSAGSSHVIPLRDLPVSSLVEPMREMLEQHAALDCVCCGLWDGASLQPLIFTRKIYRGIHAARLVFTSDRASVFAHLPAISRFLLREKFLLLGVNANHRERVAGAIFTQRTAPTFYKGSAPPTPGDFAFSEFVFLQI